MPQKYNALFLSNYLSYAIISLFFSHYQMCFVFHAVKGEMLDATLVITECNAKKTNVKTKHYRETNIFHFC